MRNSRLLFFSLAVIGMNLMVATDVSFAQRKGINQDESKVPTYELPKLLTSLDGSKTSTSDEWESKRRPEVFKLFADHVYGNVPNTNNVKVEFLPGDSWEVLDDKAVRREVEIRFNSGDKQVSASLLLTLPKSDEAVPCFIGYNFHGNHTTTKDERVAITKSWVRKKRGENNQNKAQTKDRGTSASRWPYAEVIEQGFGIGTIYYGDVDPDFHDEFKNGIQPLFYGSGQDKPTKTQWGSIGAWAWGLSQTLNYLEQDPNVDAEHVAVVGHSRLGKTSLWAGAMDQRFWITISNNSGCGGAALHRRKFGETVKVINTNFPHWFCDQFTEYNDKEPEIPVDQHMLMALIAPRPVYVASATKDLWADPKGEYLSLAGADPVYRLYGDSAMSEMPSPDKPAIVGSRGYHIRSGKHDITSYDWQQYVKFAKLHLK